MQIITQTDRLCIRQWTESDRDPFAQMNTDPEVMTFLGPPLSRQASDDIIDRQLALTEAGEPAFWAVERLNDKAFMGCIGVKWVTFEADFTPCYEIGWRLGRSYWGQGYATEGAKAVMAIVFNRWDMPSIYSFTVVDNVSSQSVMQKIGMARVVEGDFDHPKLAKDDSLLRHVLYKIDREQVAGSA